MKKKWYKTTWKLVVFIVISVISAFLVIMNVVFLIEQNTAIRHQSIIARGTLGLGWEGRLYNSNRVVRFDEAESSVRRHSEIVLHPYSNYVREEIVAFDASEFHLSIYSGDSSIPFLVPLPSFRQIPNISIFVLATDGEYFSDPIYFWQHFIEATGTDERIWYCEDRIARDIVISHFRGDITSLVNDGVMLLYGVGVGEVPQTLSILGYEPDVIIPFTNSNGEMSFLWYFYNMSKVSDILEAHIDFDSFTLAEIIELFDIRIVGT